MNVANTNILCKEETYMCPYDSNHKINGTSWHTHILKCQKANPDIAKNFARCPFTAYHVVRKTEMGEHLKVCQGRSVLENEARKGEKKPTGNCTVPLYSRPAVANQTEEDWDDEIQQQDKELIENAAKKHKVNNGNSPDAKKAQPDDRKQSAKSCTSSSSNNSLSSSRTDNRNADFKDDRDF